MSGGTVEQTSRPRFRSWTAFATITFVLHWAWEVLQGPLYADLAGMTLAQHALPCAKAAGGDVLLSGLALLATSAAIRNWRWPFERRRIGAAAIWVVVGLVITVVIELFATRLGRWTYAPSMPTVLGVGLSPLLQWSVLPPLSLLVLSRLVPTVASGEA